MSGVDAGKAARIALLATGITIGNAPEKLNRLRLELVRHAGTGQPLGSFFRGQIKPDGERRLHQCGLGRAGLNHELELFEDGFVKATAAALVGKGRVGESVTQDHITPGQRRQNDAAQMVAPGGKHQQRLGQRVHRIVEHQRAQLFSQRRATRLTGQRDRPALGLEGVGQRADVGGFTGTVNAFKADEKPRLVRHAQRPRMYLLTARLCSSSVALNWLLPSPRATK